MPITGGPIDAQQGMPPVASQQPSFVLAQTSAPPQQSSSQLDAYVAAASAAQQYAQYYEVNQCLCSTISNNCCHI